MSFSIGDKVYVPSVGMRQVEEKCPVCFGKLFVTVILGDDSKAKVACDYCGRGYEGPKGYLTVYKYAEPTVSSYTIKEIRIEKTSKGEKIEYITTNSHVLEESKCFATKDEAFEQAKKQEKIAKEKEEKDPKFLKGDPTKSYAWNVGYHLTQAAEARSKLEYHEKKAALCKAKDKSKE